MKTLICTRNILIKLNEWNKYVELIRFNWDDYVEDDSAHLDDANDDYQGIKDHNENDSDDNAKTI